MIRILLITALLTATSHADVTLLNASYDVTREFYQDFNAAFAKHWKETTGETVTINQSHGGSSKQARAVIDGLPADIVTMNQVTDLDALAEVGKLIPKNWRERFPNNSAPYSSTIVFLVRKGNPKNIRDWNDLVRKDVTIVVPNPKTSGNGRYSYLAAWAYALQTNNNDEAKAKQFISQWLKNIPVLDTGGRGATTTFDARGIGDVLLTFESETALIVKETGGNKYEIVIPSLSIFAEAPATFVDKVVNKRGTQKVARAYIDYLFSAAGQELVVKHHFRPITETGVAQFPAINLFRVEDVFGSWNAAQKKHFADGGVYDQVFQPQK